MYAVKYMDGTKCDILNNRPREITVFYGIEYTNLIEFFFLLPVEILSFLLLDLKSLRRERKREHCWLRRDIQLRLRDDRSHKNYLRSSGLQVLTYLFITLFCFIDVFLLSNNIRLTEKSKKTISCFADETSGSLTKPRDLLAFETTRDTLLKSSQNRVQMTNRDGETFIIHYKTIDSSSSDDANANNNNINNDDQLDDQQQQETSKFTQSQLPYQQSNYVNQPSGEAEKEMIGAFLSGASCLTGGVGWWKYEVCLGKQVNQFHEVSWGEKKSESAIKIELNHSLKKSGRGDKKAYKHYAGPMGQVRAFGLAENASEQTATHK